MPLTGTTLARLPAFLLEQAEALGLNRVQLLHEAHLSDQELAIYEIAYSLGYSEPSTFYRAFRRWKRTSPQEIRKSPNRLGSSSDHE